MCSSCLASKEEVLVPCGIAKVNKVREGSLPRGTSRVKSEKLETATRNVERFLIEVGLMLGQSRENEA
jgi:hypothetical protein